MACTPEKLFIYTMNIAHLDVPTLMASSSAADAAWTISDFQSAEVSLDLVAHDLVTRSHVLLPKLAVSATLWLLSLTLPHEPTVTLLPPSWSSSSSCALVPDVCIWRLMKTLIGTIWELLRASH